MENLRVYISTWNVATNSPPSDLSDLLDFPPSNKQMPDFYVLGFQEVKSQPQNIVMNAIFSEPWTQAIAKILSKNSYVKVSSIRLQGLLLLVFCLRVHLTHLRDVETQYTRTGLGGVWGNKGAVSLRLGIYGCSICFVNAHLAAHEHQLDDRIADYNAIIKSNTFNTKETTNILFHDYVFWMGDLNFRLTEEADTPEVIVERVKRAEKDDYSELLLCDQLRKVILSGDAFSELKEATPRFPPTYKYVIGSNEYDLKRRPSWTDRILHKVNPNNYENITLNAVQLSYHSLSQYSISDHKPVIAEFNIKIRNKQRLRTCYGSEEIFKTRSSSAFNSIPEQQVVFSNYTERSVDFSPIKSVWYFGDADLLIEFSLSSDVEINPNDWIGVYEADFYDLDDYISYEYVGKVNTFIPGEESTRIVKFSFPVGSGVRSPGFYRFLYFSQPSSDVRSLLGISKKFEVKAREGDNLHSSLQNDEQIPSISRNVDQASSSNQDSSAMGSIIKQLSNIHVPGFKFDVQNDLSID